MGRANKKAAGEPAAFPLLSGRQVLEGNLDGGDAAVEAAVSLKRDAGSEDRGGAAADIATVNGNVVRDRVGEPDIPGRVVTIAEAARMAR